MLWECLANIRIKRDKPKLVSVLNENSNSVLPTISFVIPVFNQASVISKNLKSVINNTELLAEIIIINDASEDDSEEAILNFIEDAKAFPQNIISVHLYSFRKSRFETYCDHFGIMNAKGRYIIEIQADMEITEPAFDKKMVDGIESDHRIFMASGRGIMDFESVRSHFMSSSGTEASSASSLLKSMLFKLISKNKKPASPKTDLRLDPEDIFPTSKIFKETKRAGRLGRLIELEIPRDLKHLYVGETVMRGPLAFEKDRYLQLGGLNTKSFFLGFDEHDLNLRGRQEHAWLSAYIPIAFNSPLENGSMRKKRSRKARVEIFLAQKRIKRFAGDSALSKASSLGKIEFQDHEKK